MKRETTFLRYKRDVTRDSHKNMNTSGKETRTGCHTFVKGNYLFHVSSRKMLRVKVSRTRKYGWKRNSYKDFNVDFIKFTIKIRTDVLLFFSMYSMYSVLYPLKNNYREH